MPRTCERCGAANRPEALHCLQCGGPLAATTAPAQLCPAGRHPMEPDWTDCPYCRASAPVRSGGRVAVPTPAGDPVVRSTIAEGVVVPAVVRPGPAVQERPPTAAATPGAARIAGVLVTYTWDHGGQLFAVREGRTRVGSDPRCEIALDDSQLSPRHATIVCHRGHFFISDDRSRTGTDVNGERLSSHRPLPDRALIRTGATTWLFLALDPPGGEEPVLVP